MAQTGGTVLGRCQHSVDSLKAMLHAFPAPNGQFFLPISKGKKAPLRLNTQCRLGALKVLLVDEYGDMKMFYVRRIGANVISG